MPGEYPAWDAGREAAAPTDVDFESDPVPPQTLDTVFRALSDPTRRRVLEYLRESTTEAASVSELADVLSSQCPESTDRDDVEVLLVHSVLPKLADAALVRYDSEAGTVRAGDEPLVDACLDLAAQVQ